MMKYPPFCPNKACENHEKKGHSREKNRWYSKDGFYKTHLHNKIQRFLCRGCGTRFSIQTFSLNYGVKKELDFLRIFQQINAGSSIRQLARNLKVTDKVITNRLGRLARQSISMQSSPSKKIHLNEDLTVDGLTTGSGRLEKTRGTMLGRA